MYAPSPRGRDAKKRALPGFSGDGDCGWEALAVEAEAAPSLSSDCSGFVVVVMVGRVMKNVSCAVSGRLLSSQFEICARFLHRRFFTSHEFAKSLSAPNREARP